MPIGRCIDCRHCERLQSSGNYICAFYQDQGSSFDCATLDSKLVMQEDECSQFAKRDVIQLSPQQVYSVKFNITSDTRCLWSAWRGFVVLATSEQEAEEKALQYFESQHSSEFIIIGKSIKLGLCFGNGKDVLEIE